MLKISQKDNTNFLSLFHIKKDINTHEKELFSKTSTYLYFAKWIPGIEMIGVCNSLSMFATHPDSDIDLFVITKENRLWTVRVLLTLFFFLVWQRKTWDNHAGKFCLSFFIDNTVMNLEDIAIENDIYLFHWMLYLKPIINYNHTYEKFIEANTSWSNLWDFKEIIEDNKKYIQTQKNKWSCCMFFWNIMENILKKLFTWKTVKSFESLWKPFWIVINNHMLKFHNDDKRKEIQKQFQ